MRTCVYVRTEKTFGNCLEINEMNIKFTFIKSGVYVNLSSSFGGLVPDANSWKNRQTRPTRLKAKLTGTPTFNANFTASILILSHLSGMDLILLKAFSNLLVALLTSIFIDCMSAEAIWIAVSVFSNIRSIITNSNVFIFSLKHAAFSRSLALSLPFYLSNKSSKSPYWFFTALTLGSPIIDGKYIFGSKKCIFILVLLCLQLYWLRAVQFNARSPCDASMFTSCIYIFYIYVHDVNIDASQADSVLNWTARINKVVYRVTQE